MTPEPFDPPAGLCGSCRNARIVDAKTGSRFYLCQLSVANPRFAKYPRLPVLRCAGFTAGGNAGTAAPRGGEGG